MSGPIRVLVTGGRDYGDQAKVYRTLDALHGLRPIAVLIHGACTGADALAAAWAKDRGVAPEPYPAAWDDIERPGAVVRVNRAGRRYDVLAGRLRNQRMIDEGKPDLVVAFPGENGTADMTSRAKFARIQVVVVER